MKRYRQKTSLKILFIYIGIFAVQFFLANLGDMSTFGRIYGMISTDFQYVTYTPFIELAGYSTSLVLGVIVYFRLKRMTKSEIKTTILLSRASVILIIFWVFHDFAYLTTAFPIILPARGIYTIPPLFYLHKALKKIAYVPPLYVKTGAGVTSEQEALSINQVQNIALPRWSIPLIDSTIVFLILMFLPTLALDIGDFIYLSPYRTQSLFDRLPVISYFSFYNQIFLSVSLLSLALFLGIWSSLEVRMNLKGEDKQISMHAINLIKFSAPIYLFWILHGLIVSPLPICYFALCELSIPLPFLISLPFAIHLFWNALKCSKGIVHHTTEIGQRLPAIDNESIQVMHGVGIKSLQDLANEDPGELSKILELPQEQVKKWIQDAYDVIPKPPLNLLPGIDHESIKILQKVGIKSLKDLAKEDPSELGKILDLPLEQVEKWIRDARETMM